MIVGARDMEEQQEDVGRATMERSCGNGFKKIVSYRIKGERSSESPPAEGVLV